MVAMPSPAEAPAVDMITGAIAPIVAPIPPAVATAVAAAVPEPTAAGAKKGSIAIIV